MSTFEEALYNVLQFAGDKKTGSGGQILLNVGPDEITVYAHDDFTFIRDTFPRPKDSPLQGVHYFDKDDVKEWLKEGTVPTTQDPTDADSFATGIELIRDADRNTVTREKNALSAERFRKLSLLKPQGNPVDLLNCDEGGHPYVAFKVGTTLRGVLSVLDRSVVQDELGAEYLW